MRYGPPPPPHITYTKVIRLYRARWWRWWFSRSWREMAQIDAEHQARMQGSFNRLWEVAL